jgi:VWFA-related protein
VLYGGTAHRIAAQQPPQFRAGVDLTRLEVTVLDRRTRLPVSGLTAADFTVTVSGREQPVATLVEVRESELSQGRIAAKSDVTTNEVARPRLLVIVFNDASGNRDPFNRRTGIAIARQIVSEMASDDRIAVVFTRDNRRAQNFTRDVGLLHAAVDSFNPMQTAGTAPLKTLARVQSFLGSLAGYRRAIFYITPNEDLSLTGDQVNAFGIDESALQVQRELRAVASGAGLGHVPIHTFSTHGLHAIDEMDLKHGGQSLRRVDDHVERLRTIAALTGGRATVADNAPAERVDEVFEEMRSYYALGFSHQYPLDGTLRWMTVSVKRPDVVVMPSAVPIRATPSVGPATGLAERGGSAGAVSDERLAAALASPVPGGALPLRLSATAIRGRSGRNHTVALTLALPVVPHGVSERFRVATTVFDGEGRRELLNQTQEVSLVGDASTASAPTEVILPLSLAPGRYNIRVAASRRNVADAGNVDMTVVVPDFSGESLALSGLAVGVAGRRPPAGQEVLSGLMPFAPTSSRTFGGNEQAGAWLRVYQPDQSVKGVTVTTSILDAAGAAVVSENKRFEAGDFVDGVVEHRINLPLASLKAGEYLLEVVAVSADRRVYRDLRFVVEQR